MKKYTAPCIQVLALNNSQSPNVLFTSGLDTPIDTTGDADDY